MPILEAWAQVLVGSFERLWYDIALILPNIMVAIVLLILGWVVGAGLSKLVSQIIKALRVDTALRAAGVEGVVERAGYTLNAGEFLGTPR